MRVEDLIKYCREVGPDEQFLRFTKPEYYLDNVEIGNNCNNINTLFDDKSISKKYQARIREMMLRADRRARKESYSDNDDEDDDDTQDLSFFNGMQFLES